VRSGASCAGSLGGDSFTASFVARLLDQVCKSHVQGACCVVYIPGFFSFMNPPYASFSEPQEARCRCQYCGIRRDAPARGLCTLTARRVRCLPVSENFCPIRELAKWMMNGIPGRSPILAGVPCPVSPAFLYIERMAESFRLRRLGLAALTAALVAVSVHAASGPLRAITSTVSDTTGYVGLAAWILDGRPADMHEVPWRCREFPVGYPTAIAGLYRCGLATPRGLLALNFISLSIGLWASWILLRRVWQLPVDATWSALLLVASSTVCGELAVSVASEMLFFAASLAALAWAEHCGTIGEGSGGKTAPEEHNHAARFVPPSFRVEPRPDSALRLVATALFSLLACAAAISIRTAGIALIPALLWVLLTHPFVKRIGTRRVLAVVALPLAIGLWFGVARILRSEYVANILAARYSSGTAWDVIALQQLTKVSAFGELFTNLRAEDFQTAYRGEFVLGGLLCLAMILAGFGARVRRLRPLDVYLMSYAAIIFVYPFFSYGSSRRFWFPVLPFVFGLAWLAIDRLREKSPRLRRWAGPVLAVYVTAFVLFGCIQSIELSRFDRHTDQVAAKALAGLNSK
jgi:hypothetical protein